MADIVGLTPSILAGFDKYKYSAVDSSPIGQYITHPFWNWIVQFLPLWLAPNLLTLVGFLLLLVSYVIMTYYDVQFYASSLDNPEYPPIPNWVWLVCALNNFIAHTLDGIDGKQARRTNSSTPLGELFDHGLDSWATLFLPIAIYSVFGRGDYSVGVFHIYAILIGTMMSFFCSHWEKYNTGVLFLPWGYDASQLAMTIFYLVTYFGGYEMWKFIVPVLNIPASVMVEIIVHMGFIGLTFPTTFINIYRSYKNKTGKMRSFPEATRPLVSTLFLFTLLLIWAIFSKYEIMEKHPRLFMWTTGTTFSNIACRLIVAQMSNTRCELINIFLIPLSIIVIIVLLLQPGRLEVVFLWVYCLVVTVTHVYYGVSVVCQMCRHFKIHAFSLEKLSVQ
ncbi:ethanolaminephosphotransferase 1 isoform X1 [Octopus bimaculoides]|uniref:ethanolaminephosphotransferase 1 isoform X1 n=1 Tax=Octopus bimaculoides TaxID=37653 RepID=UPI0022E305A1|nr:ethanolaminephosphotransferase 1 isoform X1 [Octopus bimaculoides]